jgi:hypothetical protein
MRRSPKHNGAQILGRFIQEKLIKHNLSREDFASALDMEQELADSILDGVLPVSEYNDDLLEEIAAVISSTLPRLKEILRANPETDESDPSSLR